MPRSRSDTHKSSRHARSTSSFTVIQVRKDSVPFLTDGTPWILRVVLLTMFQFCHVYDFIGMGGESYLDVIQRLNPLIIELERMSSDMVIVTHRVVLRILLGYMMDIDRAKMPEMEVPLHTLYCVEPKPHGTVVKRYRWVEEQDWFVEDQQPECMEK
jgi:hypothetical protein